ncbi:unnamed protein product [Dibothriocephalus latus]|uniref:Tetraspanin n=1 Tax=Dibothriocephalus latus TaxID=60516 RepID=A0A3P7QMK6_DIBLA|nr:unnamed protein product [Dibothriocephalus latus]
MRRGIDDYYQQLNPNTKVRFMDSVQKLLKCCGVTSPRDYRDQIPLACCNISTSSCQTTPIEEEHVYSESISWDDHMHAFTAAIRPTAVSANDTSGYMVPFREIG